MKLLLDENLSEALLPRLPAQFVGSSHVRHLLAEGTIDRVIWDTAAAGGYAIVTLDSDFKAMSVIRAAFADRGAAEVAASVPSARQGCTVRAWNTVTNNRSIEL